MKLVLVPLNTEELVALIVKERGLNPNYVLVQGGFEDGNGFTKFIFTVRSAYGI